MHQQFLGNTPLANFFFKRLVAKGNLSSTQIKTHKHVFITGLARAGTTAILNDIYSTNEFASFLYRHMPFILSPKLAMIFSKFNNKNQIFQERYHKDGIMVNTNSPECLDEVFWIKANKDYYSYSLNAELITNQEILNGYNYLLSSFSKFQNKERLLIKNNNNHIRLKCLSKYFTESFFLVIFREPIYQSLSLLRMHKRFSDLQTSDSYILDYMNLIGHREFGLGAKSFIYNNDISYSQNNYSMDSINYWLEQWINCYSWLLENNFYSFRNVYFVCYEKLCKDPKYLKNLYKILEINKISQSNFSLKNKEICFTKYEINESLIDKAHAIYDKMKNLKLD